MKTKPKYYVALSAPEDGLAILGGGWTVPECLEDVRRNGGGVAVGDVVIVGETLGKFIEKTGGHPELAAFLYEMGKHIPFIK